MRGPAFAAVRVEGDIRARSLPQLIRGSLNLVRVHPLCRPRRPIPPAQGARRIAEITRAKDASPASAGPLGSGACPCDVASGNVRVVPAVLLLDLPKDAIPGLRRVFDVRARQGNKWGVPQLERRAPVRRRCGVARPQYALPCRCFVLERAP